MDAECQAGLRCQHWKMLQGVEIRPGGKIKLKLSRTLLEAFVTGSFRRMASKRRMHLFEKPKWRKSKRQVETDFKNTQINS